MCQKPHSKFICHFFPKTSLKICNVSTIYSNRNLKWVNVRCCTEGQLHIGCLHTLKGTMLNVLNFPGLLNRCPQFSNFTLQNREKSLVLKGLMDETTPQRVSCFFLTDQLSNLTRMYSSRMRTSHSSTVWGVSAPGGGVSAPGGVCPWGVSAPGGVCSGQGSALGGVCSSGGSSLGGSPPGGCLLGGYLLQGGGCLLPGECVHSWGVSAHGRGVWHPSMH